MKTHMPEHAFQQRVTDLCDWLGLKWFHDNDSRRNNSGFPDLVIVGPGGVVFAELKSTKGRVSLAQTEWMEALRASDQRAYIWRPEDWDDVQSILREVAKR